MKDDLETFLSFDDEDQATLVGEKLKANGIFFVIEKSKPILEKSFVDTSISRSIHLKLQRHDFEIGHKILEDVYGTEIDQVDGEYFLFSFSEDELIEVISKPDEWGHFNYQLAQKILKQRGI